ncbi:MAG TPA: nucleotide sugar dehydrogenase [Candidatus Udaeobacter sp.]|nr:nucleotide sugar dehydrogenase [Candidatus Udaeobacter sp.]
MTSTKVAVIGLWHLGCTASASLAEVGCTVTGVDFDKKVIADLKQNKPPLFEPGLAELIEKNQASGRLDFTVDFKDALADKKFIFIGFDTPVDDKDRPDASVIYKACEKIAQYAASDCVVIIMSQVKVGTCRDIKKFILQRNPKMKCTIVYNPENLMLGQAIKKFLEPDRVIIGLEDESIKPAIENFYQVIGGVKIYMDLESAEMVKHATNSFLAMSISFINEIADICELVGADVRKVVEGLKADGRIGQRAFLSPGIGYAGGTLGRDIAILSDLGKAKKVKTQIINATGEINNSRQAKVINKIKNIIGPLKNKKIAILGLTYKPGTSTLRRSMSLEIAKKLLAGGAKVKAYDPKVVSAVKGMAGIKIYADAYSAIADADVVLLATDWPEFKDLDFAKVKKLAGKAAIIDCKNFLPVDAIKNSSIAYYGIGFKTK